MEWSRGSAGGVSSQHTMVVFSACMGPVLVKNSGLWTRYSSKQMVRRHGRESIVMMCLSRLGLRHVAEPRNGPTSTTIVGTVVGRATDFLPCMCVLDQDRQTDRQIDPSTAWSSSPGGSGSHLHEADCLLHRIRLQHEYLKIRWLRR